MDQMERMVQIEKLEDGGAGDANNIRGSTTGINKVNSGAGGTGTSYSGGTGRWKCWFYFF